MDDSSTSTGSSDDGNQLSREQRFFFTNDFFDIRDHIGDGGFLISGIEELDQFFLVSMDITERIIIKNIKNYDI